MPQEMTVTDGDGRAAGPGSSALAGHEHAGLLAGLVDGMQDYAILLLDANGIISTWNAGAQRSKGYTAAEIIGRHFSVFYPPEEIAAGRPSRELEIAALEGRLEDEGWRVRQDGTRFWANVVITALRGADGAVRAFGKITRDLTDRKQMEREALQGREQALEASRLKSEFVANMSHEIRTPLNGVIGLGGLLAETDLNDEQREYADGILASGDVLLAVISSILDFSKIEAGKLELDVSPFNIRELVESASEMLATTAADKDIELMTWIDEDLPDRVSGDGPRLKQILANLLSNAVKFTAAGEVVVRVSNIGDVAGGPVLRFEVADTGIGISPAATQGIFDSFSQADSSTTRRYGGTGLGLSISKRLVDLMGGEIGVDSAVGQGSTFWFSVALEVAQSEGTAGRPVGADGVRVLVVDDNYTNRMIVQRQLTAWDMDCATAPDGAIALASLREAAQSGWPYRLVVLDSKMPRMSGLELVAEIKASPALRALRLLMVSSSGTGREAALQAGIDGFVTKPVRQRRLCEEITHALAPPSRTPASPPAERRVVAKRPATTRGLVLLAEDVAVNQIVATALLTKRGFAVDLATDGRQAVEKWQHGNYAAIFMDCQMPELDGYEATAEIRRREHPTQHTPIVAMTAHTMPGDRERCRQSGMDDYLAKPVASALLDALLAAAPWAQRTQRAVEAPPPDPTHHDEQAPVFDRRVLQAICDGDDEIRARLVAMFLTHAREAISELEAAFAAGDAEAAQRTAHALKGSAASLGAMRLSAVAGEIFNRAAVGRFSNALEYQTTLERTYALTAGALNPTD
jgi:two-component system sensor histidine kinase/response regulator